MFLSYALQIKAIGFSSCMDFKKYTDCYDSPSLGVCWMKFLHSLSLCHVKGSYLKRGKAEACK